MLLLLLLSLLFQEILNGYLHLALFGTLHDCRLFLFLLSALAFFGALHDSRLFFFLIIPDDIFSKFRLHFLLFHEHWPSVILESRCFNILSRNIFRSVDGYNIYRLFGHNRCLCLSLDDLLSLLHPQLFETLLLLKLCLKLLSEPVGPFPFSHEYNFIVKLLVDIGLQLINLSLVHIAFQA